MTKSLQEAQLLLPVVQVVALLLSIKSIETEAPPTAKNVNKICVKNILPAAATGFGAMSSAAAMPLTILGAEKNAKDKSLAASFIPATVNIHLIGDCFAIPIFAFAILKSFGLPEPSLSSYLIFASYFVLAKFSVAAVPGGGILVMLPILEAYLGFNTEMLTLITALYLLFDPVITAANILGNGAFALILEKLTAAKPKTVPLEE
jgi:Na+/H+-dicarboxylate symporter